MYVCMYVYIHYVCMYILMYVHTYVSIYVCKSVCMCVCLRMYIFTRWYPKFSRLVPPSIQQLWWREAPVDGRTTMSSASVRQVALSWVKCAVFTRVYLESCTWPVAICTTDQRKEQRMYIKFCANLEKSATETLTMIQQAFGDQSLSRARVFQWHARFKTGGTSVDDDEHTGRPTSCTTPETVTRTQELVRQDRRRTIHDIAEEVGTGYGTCQRVLTEELGMHRVAAKFVPRILTADQKQQRVNVCTDLRQLASDDETFLSRVITGDESWVYGYDPETKKQSSQWKNPTSPRPKKARQVKSNVKSTIIAFFDVKRNVHKEFVPTGQNVNSGFYCDVLRRLRENLRRRRPKLWREQTWLLHHDNAPSHTSVLTQQYLAKNKIAVIPTHRTPLIWHPVTSSCFQKWNWSWTDAALIPLRNKPNRRECLTFW